MSNLIKRDKYIREEKKKLVIQTVTLCSDAVGIAETYICIKSLLFCQMSIVYLYLVRSKDCASCVLGVSFARV